MQEEIEYNLCMEADQGSSKITFDNIGVRLHQEEDNVFFTHDEFAVILNKYDYYNKISHEIKEL